MEKDWYDNIPIYPLHQPLSPVINFMKWYSHHLTQLARRLRRNQTKAEAILWERLRNRKFQDLKFSRQHRIGRYIADFYCAECKLVIELEGSIHDEGWQQKYDAIRFEEFEARGLRILRIRNERLDQDLNGVLKEISGHTKMK